MSFRWHARHQTFPLFPVVEESWSNWSHGWQASTAGGAARLYSGHLSSGTEANTARVIEIRLAEPEGSERAADALERLKLAPWQVMRYRVERVVAYSISLLDVEGAVVETETVGLPAELVS